MHKWSKKEFLIKIVALLIIIFMLGITGCPFPGGERRPEGGGGGGGGGQEQNTKIGVSLGNAETDAAKAVTSAFEEEDKINMVVKNANMDAMQQTIDVEDLINQEVDVIVIDMVDPSQGGKLVTRIKEKGIKVIAINNLPQNAPVDAYITPDNTRTGELQGEYVAGVVDEGKVLILAGDPNSNVAKEITSGNLIALQKNPQLQILEVKEHEEWRKEDAELNVRQSLADNMEDLKAIIANNSELAQASVDILKELGLHQQVVTIGADAEMPAMEAVVNDEHDAEVDRRPDMVGALALQAAQQLSEADNWTDFDRKIKNGEHDVPIKIVPVRLVTKDNVFLLQERLGEIQPEGEQEGGPGQGVERAGEGQGDQGNGVGGGEGGGGDPAQNGGGGQGGGQGQGGQGQQGAPSRVTIITGEGQRLDFELQGQNLEIEIEGRLKRIQTMEGQGGGNGGGGGQGGGGESGGGGGGS